MRDVRLGEVFRVKHGYAFSGAEFSDDERYPTLVTPGNFAIGGGFKSTAPKTFKGDVPREFVLDPGSLVITMTDLSKAGDTLGYPATIPGDRVYLHNQRIGLVQITNPDLVDKAFLGYYLRTSSYRAHILATSSGSTVRHTSPTRIEAFEARLPGLKCQRAIAEVLGALDAKIAANDHVLDLSDQLVRARFESLSGELVPLSHIAFNWRKQVEPIQVDPGTPYVGLEHVPRRRMWLTEADVASGVTSAKSAFAEDDVLFGKLRPYFHKVVRAPFGGVCSTDILVVRAKDPSLAGFVLAAASSDHAVRETTAASEGTRMPRTKWADLGAVEVAWPGETAARAFGQAVSEIGKLAGSLAEESRRLGRTRDELLPLLMSGRVQVSDAEKTAEDVL